MATAAVKSLRFSLLIAVLVRTISTAFAARQAAPPVETPQMSETFFKDIRVLKGIPVDEFMDTMGMFAASTAKDCTGCHSAQILDENPEAFAINNDDPEGAVHDRHGRCDQQDSTTIRTTAMSAASSGHSRSSKPRPATR